MSQREALELVFQKLHDGKTWEKRGQSIIARGFDGNIKLNGGIVPTKILGRNELVQNLRNDQNNICRFNVDHELGPTGNCLLMTGSS